MKRKDEDAAAAAPATAERERERVVVVVEHLLVKVARAPVLLHPPGAPRELQLDLPRAARWHHRERTLKVWEGLVACGHLGEKLAALVERREAGRAQPRLPCNIVGRRERQPKLAHGRLLLRRTLPRQHQRRAHVAPRRRILVRAPIVGRLQPRRVQGLTRRVEHLGRAAVRAPGRVQRLHPRHLVAHRVGVDYVGLALLGVKSERLGKVHRVARQPLEGREMADPRDHHGATRLATVGGGAVLIVLDGGAVEDEEAPLKVVVDYVPLLVQPALARLGEERRRRPRRRGL